MNNYKTIIFDLDGTLVKPTQGIIDSAKYALEKLNIKVKEKDELKFFIGPSLEESFSKFFDSDEDIKIAKNHFSDYFSKNWQKGYYLFDGVVDLLESLKNSNKKLVIATTKYTGDAEEILRHFKIDHFFDVIIGSTPERKDSAKEILIKKVFKELNIKDKNSSVMIGDTKYDIIGAKKRGINSIGVIFEEKEEFENNVPTYIVKNMEELKALLI